MCGETEVNETSYILIEWYHLEGAGRWFSAAPDTRTRDEAGTSPAAGPRLVLGAADEEMHLAMSPRELLLETEAFYKRSLRENPSRKSHFGVKNHET